MGMDSLERFISWYRFETNQPSTIDGFCCCQTESVLQSSSNPELMQVFLLFGTFADQFIYSHFQASYFDFSHHFRFPKVLTHGGDGLVSPSWFINPQFELDNKMDWKLGKKVGRMTFLTILEWLEHNHQHEELLKYFDKLLKMEVQIEFGKNTEESLKVWNILNYKEIRMGT